MTTATATMTMVLTKATTENVTAMTIQVIATMMMIISRICWIRMTTGRTAGSNTGIPE